MNFNYVSFESILIILHEINMIIVTHPTTFVHYFGVLFSGTHCKGVSKQLCVYHLCFWLKRVSDYHLGCLNSFRNAFLELSRLSSISQNHDYRITITESRIQCVPEKQTPETKGCCDQVPAWPGCMTVVIPSL